MDDLIELCGLDDFEELRLSATGVDPDSRSRRPIWRRARLQNYKTAAHLNVVRTAKQREDAARWNAFMDLSIRNLGVEASPQRPHSRARG